MEHTSEFQGRTWKCGRPPQIFCLGCSLLCRSSSDSWPLKACLQSFALLTWIQLLVFFTSFWEWIFSYDIIISAYSWSSRTITDWSTCNPKMLVTAVLMALAKTWTCWINMEGGLLCGGRQQQTIMISAYIALLTQSRILQMCPCTVRFILFKHISFVFFVFLFHNTWCTRHVV